MHLNCFNTVESSLAPRRPFICDRRSPETLINSAVMSESERGLYGRDPTGGLIEGCKCGHREWAVDLKEQRTLWVQRISPVALLVPIGCHHHMPEFI